MSDSEYHYDSDIESERFGKVCYWCKIGLTDLDDNTIIDYEECPYNCHNLCECCVDSRRKQCDVCNKGGCLIPCPEPFTDVKIISTSEDYVLCDMYEHIQCELCRISIYDDDSKGRTTCYKCSEIRPLCELCVDNNLTDKKHCTGRTITAHILNGDTVEICFNELITEECINAGCHNLVPSDDKFDQTCHDCYTEENSC